MTAFTILQPNLRSDIPKCCCVLCLHASGENVTCQTEPEVGDNLELIVTSRIKMSAPGNGLELWFSLSLHNLTFLSLSLL